MNEQLLQFIWQFGYFDQIALETTSGEPVGIVNSGYPNSNQGPDFLDAKIKIDKTTWAGSVELHLKTSDWEKHNHSGDKNYSNVILHVVYENDRSGSSLPLVELKERIPHSLLLRYKILMESKSFIPCERLISSVPAITIQSWKERLMAERLTRKGQFFLEYLSKNNQHWEESFWWLLAKNFGGKVNAEAFEAVAKSIPLKILSKHKNQLIQLEALLLGQAGLLNGSFTDSYPQMLQKEHRFFKTKYKLPAIPIPVHFLRMRPANFPTIRLAQLAALIQNAAHLFSRILDEPSITEVKKWFTVNANDFWHYHYRFDDESVYKIKSMGADMIDSIIINTVAPVLFVYGTLHQNQKITNKAIQWLEETKGEKNQIIQGFSKIGLSVRSALDSQALIELKSKYCNFKNCLHCAIGNHLLKKS